ncbi:MAG: hypothetical protein CM1200mP15_22050 [Dehalococcoidia bacterium]|nr:MAG: hypothetical protein CM1200mP15_22050 [Dehalococcoidia bacterium]
MPDVPLSRLLTFTEGSREVKVQCYLHTSGYAPEGGVGRSHTYKIQKGVNPGAHPFRGVMTDSHLVI